MAAFPSAVPGEACFWKLQPTSPQLGSPGGHPVRASRAPGDRARHAGSSPERAGVKESASCGVFVGLPDKIPGAQSNLNIRKIISTFIV